jgi:hypothetical protein
MNADTLTPGQARVAQEAHLSMERALMFGEFLDSLLTPTRAQREMIAVAEQLRPSKSEIRRQRLIARDGGQCWLCDKPLGNDITIEHHVPRAAGGSGDDSNLVLCHELCNKALAHRTPEEKAALRTATRLAAGRA